MERYISGISEKFLPIIPAADRKSFNRIGFHIEAAWWFYQDYCRPQHPSLPNLNFRGFAPLLLACQPGLLSPFGGLNALPRLIESFFNYRSQIPVCGAALFDSDRKRILLVRGFHSSSKWTFPRGKMNAHEGAAACAIREVWEEIGYDITLLIKEDQKLEWIKPGQHPIRIYLVTLPSEATQFKFEPKTSGEIGQIGWHRMEALRKLQKIYFDVRQFERGLVKYSEMQRPSEPMVLRRISMSDLFPRLGSEEQAQQQQSDHEVSDDSSGGEVPQEQQQIEMNDPFLTSIREENDTSGQEPIERMLDLVDELGLVSTNWLSSSIQSVAFEDSDYLLDILKSTEQPSGQVDKEEAQFSFDSQLLASPKIPQSAPSEGEEDKNDLISLILFGKKK